MKRSLRMTLVWFLAASFAGALRADPSAHAAPAAPKSSKAQAGARRGRPGASNPAPVKVTSVEGITEYRLANGLRVLLFPDPTKPTVTVNLTYLVGSRHESYGETGMAHLLEHMLFKGSHESSAGQSQELTAHGARSNGSTWFDRTNYFETVQASDENLKWALELEADRMVNSFVAKKDLDTRDDRRPQRVRDGRERSRQASSRSESSRPPTSGTTTASRRSARGPTSRTCRSSACRRSTTCTTSRTTPCCWSPASFDEAKTLALDPRHLRQDSPAQARPPDDLHRGADAGRRAQRDAATRRRRAGDRRRVSRAVGHRPLLGRGQPPGERPDRHAVGPPVQGAGRDEEGDARSAATSWSCTTPAS